MSRDAERKAKHIVESIEKAAQHARSLTHEAAFEKLQNEVDTALAVGMMD